MFKPFLYKSLAIILLLIFLALGAVLLHFYLAKAEIIIKAGLEELTVDFIQKINLDLEGLEKATTEETTPISDEIKKLRETILGKSQGEDVAGKDKTQEEQKADIKAKYYEIILEDNYSVIPTGEQEEILGKTQGVVSVLNNSSRNQPLVANTRLLTPEGILFRIQKSINVPAGGKVEVQAQADQPGKQGDIGPSVFTIPGLSPSLQKQIYAENSAPFSGGVKILSKITVQDLENAKKQALETLESQALVEFTKKDSYITFNDISSEIVEFIPKTKEGESVENFSSQIKAKFSALSFDKNLLEQKTEQKLTETYSEKSLLKVKGESLNYKIEKIDILNKNAELKVSIAGYFTIKENNNLIKPADLVGLTAREAQDKILENKNVSEVTIRFSPFWVRQVPRLIKNVKIIIQPVNREDSL